MASSRPNSRPTTPAPGASATKQRHHPLLQRPLYAFQLPPTILDSIKLRSIDVEPATVSSAPTATSSSSAAAAPAAPATSSTGPVCTLCASRPTFPSVAHQRAHFRSDWHRYNLQLTLNAPQGSTPQVVDEKQWEALVEGLSDGEDDAATQATTDDEASSPPQRAADLVSLVLRKLTISREPAAGINGSAEDDEDLDADDFDADGRPRRSITAKSALLWFTTPPASSGETLLEQTQLGVYRTLFPDAASKSVEHLQAKAAADPAAWHLDALKTMQAQPLRRPVVPKAKAGGAGWRGKRLKGMDEAAGMLGISFLEGEGFIPGLVTRFGQNNVKRQRDDDDEDASESDGSVSSSSDEEDDHDAASSASSVPLPRHVDPPLRTWTIILFGGGHFSAVVVALNPYLAPRAATKNRPLPAPGSDDEIIGEDRSIVVLAHKAFHRYTTRRKQGGAQSAQDATGRFAKSAGAQLRRAGEAALAEETRALLAMSGWRKLVGESERVYVRAGARAARGILWSWPGVGGADASSSASPLEEPRSDGRLCNIPFSTRSSKATVGECLRVFAELARVKVSRRTEAELEEEDEAYRRSLAGNDAVAREEVRKRRQREREQREKAMLAAREEAKRKREQRGVLSGEEKKRRDRIERMVEMVRRGRVDALATLWEKHGAQLLEGGDINAALPAWWRANEAGTGAGAAAQKTPLVPSTLLHLAAEAGQADVIQWLLVEKRADPTIGVPQPPTAASTSTTSDQEPGPDGALSWPHRTAYALLPASSRPSRNVFRRLYAQQPDWYDWSGTGPGGARVESALTEEMEGNQNRRRANMREKARQREKAREEAAESKSAASTAAAGEQPAAPVAPAPASSASKNRLGGPQQGVPRGLQKQKDQMEGVSPEMRMRIEREKRARAAEERMKRLQQQ